MTGNSYGWAEYGSQSSSLLPALFRLPSWTPIPKSFFHLRSRQSNEAGLGTRRCIPRRHVLEKSYWCWRNHGNTKRYFLLLCFSPIEIDGQPLWPSLYELTFAKSDLIVELFGSKLNFFHAAFLASIIALILSVVVSLQTQPDGEKGKFTWTELGGHDSSTSKGGHESSPDPWSIVVLGLTMVGGWTSPLVSGIVAATWTWFAFAEIAFAAVIRSQWKESRSVSFPKIDFGQAFWQASLSS